MKLGEILLKMNLATPDQIDVALEMQSKSGGRLGDCLIAIGVISDKSVCFNYTGESNP